MLISSILDDLRKIENGFYLEVGAHDGVFQSNTYHLEKKYNWSGLLIEPSKICYNRLLENRDQNKNIILNCALVNDGNTKKVKGDFNGNPMASIEGMRGGFESAKGKNLVEVDACNLSDILKKYNISKINFFSLDVEGYEYEILKSIDYDFCDIECFLIEVYLNNKEKIIDFLKRKDYHYVEIIQKHQTPFEDIFFKKNKI